MVLSIISTVGGVFLYFFKSIISIAYSFDVFSFIALGASLLGVFISYELFYLGRKQKLTQKIRNISEKIADYGYEKFIITIGNAISTLGFYIGSFDLMFSNAMSRVAESTFILSSKTREIEKIKFLFKRFFRLVLEYDKESPKGKKSSQKGNKNKGNIFKYIEIMRKR